MGVGPFLILIILRFYQPLYYSYALRGPCFFVVRFYGHCIFGRPSGGRNLFVLRFYGHSLIGRPSGGRNLFILRFYRPRSATGDLRWPHLSLHDER